MSHEERMEIAARLRDRILEAYGDAVLAVFVTSSTAKGLDKAHSDLELTAVFRNGVEIEARSYVYNGILVEIDYVQESVILRDARRVTARWPLETDEYRSRLVLFERDGWTRLLDEAIASQEDGAFSRALHLAATMVVEDRDKLRNAVLAGDELNVRANAFLLAQDAANLILFLNRRYMVTSRRLFEQAFESPEKPPNFRQLVHVVMGMSPVGFREVAAAAEALSQGLLDIVVRHGISVESTELLV